MSAAELRHARERLGLSLREVADRTRIRAAILEAIENQDIDRLPPRIFTRGFVKAYAREVGLDPQAVAARYDALLEPANPPGDNVPPPPHRLGDRIESPTLTGRERSSLVTAAIIVVAGGLFVLTDSWNPSTLPADKTTAAPASTDGTAIHDAVATTGETRRAAGSVARRPNMRIDLAPQGPCWIEATADGERVIYKLLHAGDRYAIEGYEDLVLKVGDPAALAFSIDGVKGRPLGPAGQPATVHITRENSREFAPGRSS